MHGESGLLLPAARRNKHSPKRHHRNNVIFGNTTAPAIGCAPLSTTSPPFDPRFLIFNHNDILNSGGPAFDTSCPDPTGTYGNIAADPQFVNATTGNFQVLPMSPIIDAGNNSALFTRDADFPFNPALDLAGNQRVADASKGYAIVDLGVYEFSGTSDKQATNLTLGANGGDTLGLGATVDSNAPRGSSPDPTGTATFYEDGKNIGTGSFNNTFGAGLSFIATPGLHHFVATYAGDTTYEPGVAIQIVVLVGPYLVNLSLTNSMNPEILPHPVTFTAHISSLDPVPIAPVTLTDNGTLLTTLSFDSNGTATYTTSSLSLGAHTIVASYAGTANDAAASASVQEIVNSPTSITTFTCGYSSLYPSAVGEPVDLDATVTSSDGTVPKGSVKFTDSGTLIGTEPLDAMGNATLTTSTLSAADHIITVTYVPTGSYATSSATFDQLVEAGFSTTTTLRSSFNPSTTGKIVTFYVTVTQSDYVPTGSVQFTDGATILSTQVLPDTGQVRFATSTLAAGSHIITASFIPTGYFNASSAALTQTVNGLASAAILTVTPTTTAYGSQITLAASVSAANTPATPVPTGTVTFADGAAVIGTVSLTASAQISTGSFSTSGLAAGPHSFSCTYSGDATYNASPCNTVPATVTAAATTLALTSSVNPAPALGTFAFDATLTTGAPAQPLAAQTIVFTLNGASAGNAATNSGGLANLTEASGLHIGTYTVDATYAGSGGYAAAPPAAFSESIFADRTTLMLTASPNPANQNQPVTLAATLTNIDASTAAAVAAGPHHVL